MARLIQESGGERREIRITGPITIGRAKSATICIDDKTLSREHTQVVPEAGRYIVRDLKSKNGTLLNGKLLHQPQVLNHGDRVKVGSATFMIAFDPSEMSATASTAPTRPATATATTRPRHPDPQQLAAALGPMMGCVYNVLFVAVVVVGAFVFKGVFTWLLGMIPS